MSSGTIVPTVSSSSNTITTATSNTSTTMAAAVGEQQGASIPPAPILKVMRLQAPDLSSPSAGSLGTPALPSPALSLPDSFGVIHIGETFTAYLGILNPSLTHSISQLSVVVNLKTPTREYTLPCRLDNTNNSASMQQSKPTSTTSGGVTLAPLQYVNAIVSRSLEEVGQHSLRVEVLYAGGTSSSSSNPRTLRKFYRFQVSSPLHIRELTVRGGDSSCFVSITIENATEGTTLVVSGVEFVKPEGLEAEKIMDGEQRWIKSLDYTMTPSRQHLHQQQQHQNSGSEILALTAADDAESKNKPSRKTAVELFDCSGRLTPGSSFRYVFHIRAVSPEAQTRGIAAGDVLGKAIFTWFKTMGEAGKIASTEIICPPSYPPSLLQQQPNSGLLSQSRFVMYKSGLSVDVAASAADKSDGYITNEATIKNNNNGNNNLTLDEIFPVTVDPIDPPCKMTIGTSYSVTLCIINHSDVPLNLQLQFRLSDMYGIVVSGKSFINVGEVGGYGGSAVTQVQMLPLMAGLCQVTGCYVVDLNSGKEVCMPPMFDVFVEPKQTSEDEKKEGYNED
jgi:hypothetical protein